MSPTNRFLLRLFASQAIPFMIFMLPVHLLITAVASDEPSIVGALLAAVFSALFFGVWMALIIGRALIRGVRTIAGELTDATLTVRQKRTISLAMNPSEAFERALEAVQAVPRAKVTLADPASGIIEARVGTEWRSWGERISVTVTERSSDDVEVVVASRPVVRLTLADYGKNLANVLAIERVLAPAAAITDKH